MWQAVILQLLVWVFYVSGQVVRPPVITQFLEKDLVRPEEVKFKQRNGFKLPCKATGSNLKWTWKHNDSDITLPSEYFKISSDGTLTGEELRSKHSGTYQCFVRDDDSKAATFSRKLKVLVTAVYDFATKQDEVKTVNLGQPFSLPCPPHEPGFGEVYRWVSKDRANEFDRSPSRGITEDGTLYIMYMTQQDINEIERYKGIKCVISAANVFFPSGLFEVKKPNPAQTDPGTLRSPSWEVQLDPNEVAVQGLTKTLYCLASGRPAPPIIWKKNGKEITSVQNALGITLSFQDRLLIIDIVDKLKHEDIYSCEAENSQNSGSPIITTTQLKVLVPPHWIGEPPASEITLNIYGNGTLECNAGGDPLPTFQWYKNGALLISGGRITISGNTLQFKAVEREDVGVYQCVAESEQGMIVSSSWVNVLAKKPSFSDTGLGPFYLFKESKGILKCQPDAAPMPEFRWLKRDAEILSGGRYNILNDGTLEIDNVIATDAGSYTCKAKNFLGEDEETAPASVLERTRITIAPKHRVVTEGTNVDLRCEATKDKSLELKYLWKKDNRIINYDLKMQWLEGQHVLKISDIQVDDGGIYTCVAYTPDPKRSEDTASAIVNIKGVPLPPSNLKITNCYNRTTNLSWIPGASNDAPITHFLVEQESQFEPSIFKFLRNVTDPKVRMVSLSLTAWATLRFIIRAVNAIGPSRPSLPTAEGICKTSVGPPDKWPDNFRGVPKKAEELDIAWTPMPKIDQNGPKFYYLLTYRKYQPNNPLTWNREKISDPTTGVFPVPNPGYYEEWEFWIYAGNSEGEGPKSPIIRSFSGQDKPGGRPEKIEVLQITPRSMDLRWQPVTVSRGSVDGYKIYYWGQSLVNARRRRRAIPSYASVATVLGKSEATVKGLSPFTKYTLAITAFNSGGEGPSSDEVTIETEDAPPGPPSQVEVFPFGEYILVRWQPPLEPNGVITEYQVGSAEYTTEPMNVEVPMISVRENVFQKLLGSLEYEKDYVVKIEAGNRKGWGDSVIKTTKTVEKSPPAKPERPTVVGTAIDKVNVTYNFGLGGGWTHEFKVLYRKKLEGETYVSTSMRDHFKFQWLEIDNLENELYQFKTVGKNDNGESIESAITEARPLPGVVNAGQRAATPIHKSAWFITLLILIAVLLLVLLIFVLYTRYRGAKYPVGKRERKRAALIDNKPYDEEEGPFDRGEDNPPPYPSQGSLDKPDQDSDHDSMDEYGEGPQFKEDGSFVEEYGDDKKAPPDEKDQSAFATFV